MRLTRYDGGLEIAVATLTPIWIHFSLPLIGLLVTIPLWIDMRLQSLISAAIVLVGMTFSLLAHELGHVIAARRYGLAPLMIRLHAGGGEAVLEGMSWTRFEDRVISCAGPATNLAIGISLLILFWGASALLPPMQRTFGTGPEVSLAVAALLPALKWLGVVNLAWAGVNLLPAFPLDGGQLCYSWLEEHRGHRSALFWTGLGGVIFAVVAKLFFIGGVLSGFPIWSPPDFAPNIEALRAARRDKAHTVEFPRLLP